MTSASKIVDLFKQALSEKWGYIFGQSGTQWTQKDQDQKIQYMVKNFGENWKKNADAKQNKYYNSALLGGKWVGHRVADCSGLFVWAYRQCGLSIAHISTTIYTQYCGKKGKLTTELKATLLPGTAVFTGDTESNHPHVGLYVGSNKVIEAAGVDAGVCTSNLTATKWKWYGQLKDVSYSSENAPETPSAPQDDKQPTTTLPTLKRGSKGEYVTLLQTKLANLGYDLGSYGVDGDFGKATEAAVKKFQKDHGLEQDGIVGKKTWAALDQGTPMQYYSVIVSHLSESQAKALAAMYANAEIEKEVG